MPKNTRSESRPTSDSVAGVSGVDLEVMVQTACEKTVQVGTETGVYQNLLRVFCPAQLSPRCSKCNSPPINGQCINHCIAMMVRCSRF